MSTIDIRFSESWMYWALAQLQPSRIPIGHRRVKMLYCTTQLYSNDVVRWVLGRDDP
jgi:hypothetical protein